MLGRETSLFAYLPPLLVRELRCLPADVLTNISELRLFRDAHARLSTATNHHNLSYMMSSAEMEACFLQLCNTAVYTHQEELAQGFITTADGFRVGVAGTAVLKDHAVSSYRDISSLCIRFSRRVDGGADGLLSFIEDESVINSLLLCGAPSCGKTTVLRDLATSLSKRHNVCVVDERQELALDGLKQCDVLSGTPKTVGMLQAVRTLSPDVIVVDELGDDADWKAVAMCAWRGVPVIASAHIRCEQDVRRLAALRTLIDGGGFSLAAFMPDRYRFEDETRIWKARELFENTGDYLGRVRLRRCGDRGDHETEKRRTPMEGVGDVASSHARIASLYDAPDPRRAQNGGSSRSDGAWVACGL